MEIIRDRESSFYEQKSKDLGNAFTIIDNNIKYYYEFFPNNLEATIKTNDLW